MIAVPSAPDFYLVCGEVQFQGERNGLWVKRKGLWVRRKGLCVKDTAVDTGTRVARPACAIFEEALG